MSRGMGAGGQVCIHLFPLSFAYWPLPTASSSDRRKMTLKITSGTKWSSINTVGEDILVIIQALALNIYLFSSRLWRRATIRWNGHKINNIHRGYLSNSAPTEPIWLIYSILWISVETLGHSIEICADARLFCGHLWLFYGGLHRCYGGLHRF